MKIFSGLTLRSISPVFSSGAEVRMIEFRAQVSAKFEIKTEL